MPGGSQLVMGKLSGRHAFFEHVRELGYHASDETLNAAFRVFKQVADRRDSLILEEQDRASEAAAAEALPSPEAGEEAAAEEAAEAPAE